MSKSIRVSNGKETLEIDAADLSSAAKDGYLPTERMIVANSKTKESFEIDPKDYLSASQDGFSFVDVKKKVGGDVATTTAPTVTSPSAAPSLSAGDVLKIKDYVTGTTQEQRNAEKQPQAPMTVKAGVTQAAPPKKLSPKQVSETAKQTFDDPLFQVWLQRADDPVGELRHEAQKTAAPDLQNYDASQLHNENEQAVKGHVADVVANGLFEGGHDAQAYLKKRGLDQDPNRPLNETEQVAVEKVKAGKEKNALLDHYSLEEAAMRKAFPDLEGKTPEQFKQENNAQAGQAYAEFINDPDVQHRAKTDPKLRLQLLRAQNNLIQHFPDYAAAQVASRISQKLEDEGATNLLSNNPTKEQADWAVGELEKEGKLSKEEKSLYEKNIVPKINTATSWTNQLARGIPIANAFADENPIKSRGVFENALSSFRNTLKGGAKTVEEATVAPALSLFSKNGLQDYHNQGVNNQLGQSQFEPKGLGKYTTTFGNIVGMIVPTILGAKGLQGAGASAEVSNGLSFALSTAGQHQADARELFKGNAAMQPVYTALMSTLDYALGGGLSKALSKGAAGAIKEDVASAIKGYTTGELSSAAAQDMVKGTIAKNAAAFLGETASHSVKGGAMMAAPMVMDAALQNAFGDHPPQFKEAVQRAFEEGVVGMLATTPLSALAALGNRNSKMGARLLYEHATDPNFREQMIATGATPEQLKNYDAAQKILRDLRQTDVASKDLPQLLLHELNQKVLSEKKSETESPSIKAQLSEQIKVSKEKAQTILDRQDVNLRPQDVEGKKTASVMRPEENMPTEATTIAPKEVAKEKSKGAKVILPQNNTAPDIVPLKTTTDATDINRHSEEAASPVPERTGEVEGGMLHNVDAGKEGIGETEGEGEPVSEMQPAAAKWDEKSPVMQTEVEGNGGSKHLQEAVVKEKELYGEKPSKGHLQDREDAKALIKRRTTEHFDITGKESLAKDIGLPVTYFDNLGWKGWAGLKKELGWDDVSKETYPDLLERAREKYRTDVDAYAELKKPNSEQSPERSVASKAAQSDTAGNKENTQSGIKNSDIEKNIPERVEAKKTKQDELPLPSKEESPATSALTKNSEGAKESSPEKETASKDDKSQITPADTINPAETKPTPAPKPKASQRLRDFADKLERGEIAGFGKGTEGIQKLGPSFNPNKAAAEAFRFIADAMDKGADLAKAIEEGWQKVRDHYRENGAKFKDEAAYKKQFEDAANNAFREAEPPGEPPLKGQSEATDGGDNWTAIRKEKLKEIAKVKEHFEKETGTSFGKIQQEGLEKAASLYPGKSLDEAVAAYTKKIAAMYDAKEDYNPTAKDLAIFQEFARQTHRKIKATEPHLDSDNHIDMMAAVAEMEGYEADLLTAAKAINPREAGTAFGFRASESRMNPDYGLQIRKMQLIKAKGGEQLTDSERTWLQKQWTEEKALMQQEATLREQGMQEAFDKQVETIKKQYETQLKKARAGEKSANKQARIIRQRTLAQKGKEIADKIRKLKTPKNGLKMDFSLGTWDLAIEGIAQLVEKGATIAEAIDKLIGEKKIGFKNDSDKERFSNEFAAMLEAQDLRESALEKLKAFDGETDVTSDMVAKGIVRDYVNSFIGEVEQKDILDAATEALQEHLPSVTKKRLMEAYLKEGEFKQPTKKQLEGSLAQQKKELVSITKLTEDLEDLESLKELRQRSFPSEREKSAYEQELFDKKKAKLIDLQEQRAKVAKEERDAQRLKDKLAELDANIKRAKEGMELITTYREKSTPHIEDAVVKKRQELAKITQENMSEAQVQKNKLGRIKEARQRQIKELKRKLDAGEYEEKEPTLLQKKDAAMIRLDRQKAELESIYRKKQQELKDKNLHWHERAIDFLRAVYVNGLIAGTGTYGKIAAMSILRPLSEAGTKLTMGKVFDAVFPNISIAAEKGGEGSSVRSMQLAFSAWFKQMGPEKMQRIYEQSNTAFEVADEKWKEAKNASEPAEVLKKLKQERDEKLLKATGNIVYQFIGGSSLKDAMVNALFHRANEIEKQFGHMDTENIKDGDWLDKTKYVLGFIGRSHSALKTFSGRFSFAAGFMARLEATVREGQELTSDKLLEIGHESYLDWERGKYQQDNFITHMWNGMVNKIEATAASKNPAWAGVGRMMQEVIRGNMPITRVPVNIFHEMVFEYTLGAIRVLEPFGLLWNKASLPKAVRDARKQVEAEGLMADSTEFKDRLKAVIQNLDPQQAATIARCFRKGTIGLGFYAFLGLTGIVHFGGFPHMGQRKEKDDDQMGDDELNAGQVQIGDKKLNHFFSGIAEHIPMFYPMLMGTGMAYEYKYQVGKGKTTWQSASKSFLTQLQTMESSVPQAKVLGGPVSWSQKIIKMSATRAEGWGFPEEETTSFPHAPKPPSAPKPPK